MSLEIRKLPEVGSSGAVFCEISGQDDHLTSGFDPMSELLAKLKKAQIIRTDKFGPEFASPPQCARILALRMPHPKGALNNEGMATSVRLRL
jgi:hypothetical protein